MTSNITEAEIVSLDIKELNKKLKYKNVSKPEQQELKKLRRKIKMNKYRRDSRMRKTTELETLLELRALLLDELIGLEQEVVYLHNSKDHLIKHIHSSDEDDEYGEFVVVD
ncbi:hypothetical protein LOD99_14503 [Oopsacas minuta]|uniref:Basic leucine zipper domain-containing protein n=1 Tax=Oopsacas minuta TaxID=111878 RepID=A0AAV7KEP3_9METZ|nr:hypothetical protein LOD99_14502 [Oopsacas minuta]KAI6659580.1 hypothetical protein LOD99_14503 [Oopsacas minuta]